MNCPKCKAVMVSGKDVHSLEFDGETLTEEIEVEQCPTGCDQFFALGSALEAAEDRIATRLVALGKRDPKTIRFMLRAVHIDEILLQSPSLDREEVKRWRHGEGTVPDAIVAWAYKVAPTGATLSNRPTT